MAVQGVDLFSVACISSTSAVAVGRAGVVVRTTDGVTWTLATTPSLQILSPLDLFCVAFNAGNLQQGVAAGLNGQILATSDGGATWIDARPAVRTTATLLACAINPSNSYAYVGGTGPGCV